MVITSSDSNYKKFTSSSTQVIGDMKSNSHHNNLNKSLEEVDCEILQLIREEKDRQKSGIELIASENFASRAVLEALSCCAHNKYSEGYPHNRYYGGNEVIDKIELLCQKRALELYELDPNKWGVNVQVYSGSPANFAVYTALVGPHGRIMGLDLTDGGHLTHGFMTEKKRVSATSLFFESMPYKVDSITGLINYDDLERNAKLFKPKLIIAGITCYSRHLDYPRFRAICDSHGAILMADMSHVSGLVAGGQVPISPFIHSDIVTTTTHKSLRGPRAALIFYRKGIKNTKANGEKELYDYDKLINEAVFPGLQGGPHNNAIASVAVALKMANNEEFKQYARQVIVNSRALCKELQDLGYHIVTGGTDNHMILVNLSPIHLAGNKAEKILEKVGIACNKNTVPGDKSALSPSGIRLGTPAVTSRDMKDTDMKTVAFFIHSALTLGIGIQKYLLQKNPNPKNFVNLKDFSALIDNKNEEISHDNEIVALKKGIESLGHEVKTFANGFPLPGIENF
ncbi:unnamed protein product [Gordionus sp. m RMFG-2023]